MDNKNININQRRKKYLFFGFLLLIISILAIIVSIITKRYSQIAIYSILLASGGVLIRMGLRTKQLFNEINNITTDISNIQNVSNPEAFTFKTPAFLLRNIFNINSIKGEITIANNDFVFLDENGNNFTTFPLSDITYCKNEMFPGAYLVIKTSQRKYKFIFYSGFGIYKTMPNNNQGEIVASIINQLKK